jgi:hypothetical protein
MFMPAFFGEPPADAGDANITAMVKALVSTEKLIVFIS